MSDQPILPTSSQPNVYGPITPSQMFERTSRLLREHFKLFFGIVLVLIGVEIVVGGILGGSGVWMGHSMAYGAPAARFLVLLPIAFVGGILVFILLKIIEGSLFIATQARLANAPMTVGEACKLAADQAGRLIGIALLVALRVIGYLLVFYMALGALAVVIALMFGGFTHVAGAIPFRPGHMPPLGIAVFVGVLLLAFVAIYCIALLWLSARYALSIPAALAENLSVTASIRRSIHLSSGSRGRLYALFLGISCIYIVIAAFTLPVQLMVAHGTSMHPGGSTPAISVVTMLLALFRILVTAVIVAFMGIAKTLCYYDLRVRKEGFSAAAAPTLPGPVLTSWPVTPDAPAEEFPAT